MNHRIHIPKHALTLLIALSVISSFCPAQKPDTVPSTSVFELDRAELRATESLRHTVQQAAQARSQSLVDSIVIVGSASPDGSWKHNRRLAMRRAMAVKNFFNANGDFPDTLFTLRSLGENEALFRRLVSELPENSDRDAILRILDRKLGPDVKEAQLKALAGGRVWKMLLKDVFPHIRMAVATVYLSNGEVPADTVSEATPMPRPEPQPQPEPQPEPQPSAGPQPPVDPTEPQPAWRRHAYIKTNAPAWALLWLNIAGEIDCAPHWSVELPVYYSGFNYFTGHLKARLLAIQPEGRYWLHPDNRGLFVGLHPGVMWYNFAFNGNSRYQDHRGRTPAVGGGVSLGWRRSDFGHEKRWNFEVTAGFGIYRLDYDYYRNYLNGPLFDRRKRTFYGLDRLAFSVSYSFDITRKKNTGHEE